MKLLSHAPDLGLLIIRLGLGLMFMLHGWPKLIGGPERWEGLALYGLPFLPEGILAIFFGLLATVAEFFGGLMLILGWKQWIAAIALMATMAVAFTTKWSDVTGLSNFAQAAGWPLELFIVFLGLLFAGPGRYRIGGRA